MVLIHNPLTDPILIPVFTRMVGILAVGFILVLLFNIRNMDRMFGSETWKRYKSWLFMTPTFLASVFFGGLVGLAFAGLLMVLGILEYTRMLNLPSFHKRILLINGIISLLTAIMVPEMVSLLPPVYFLIVVLFSVLYNKLDEVLTFASLTLFGSIWICFPLCHFVLFRHLNDGKALLVLIGFSVAMADIAAFCLGKLFSAVGIGTRATIAHQISPNKTWAGILGNVLGAVAGCFLFSSINSGLGLSRLILMGVCIGLSSVLGDMSESMIKRFAGVKDSSSLIPGHGGILDRIDSLLIVIVVCYYFLQFSR